MQRRKFLIGTAGAAIGGSALVGSGAFSRVESQRMVSIQVASDDDAYLRFGLLDTPNSENYVNDDTNGHIFIDIGEGGVREGDGPDGVGVNSNSFTWFDGMFEICNNGKADATISYELPEGVPPNNYQDDPDKDPDPRPAGLDAESVPTVAFYFKRDDGTRVVLEPGQETELDLGECEEVGVRTVTKGISAYGDDGESSPSSLVDGEVVVTADAPGAGEPPE